MNSRAQYEQGGGLSGRRLFAVYLRHYTLRSHQKQRVQKWKKCKKKLKIQHGRPKKCNFHE